MTRLRTVLGLIVGAMLVASSAAHSLLGWPPQRAALEALHASPDLMLGLAVGWHFAGVAILTFGAIVLWLFMARLRGRAVSLAPAVIFAVAYVVYGLGAFAASRVPFFLGVFTLPGLLLLVATWPSRDPA
jgi:dolichyl-phosphate-mannose--protein O-mannosyl transferase